MNVKPLYCFHFENVDYPLIPCVICREFPTVDVTIFPESRRATVRAESLLGAQHQLGLALDCEFDGLPSQVEPFDARLPPYDGPLERA